MRGWGYIKKTLVLGKGKPRPMTSQEENKFDRAMSRMDKAFAEMDKAFADLGKELGEDQ